jgi:hypothetical protein
MASKPHKATAKQHAPTAAQRSAWSDFGVVSAVWAKLTEEQRQAWNADARSNRRGRRAGPTRRPSGYSRFMKANLRRKALGQELLTNPPGSEHAKPFPLVRFFITNIDGRVALKLMLTHGSAEGLMLYSWHPCSAGTTVWDKFIRIGPVPPAVRGARNFTGQYVAKFGVPPVGTKIFIRLRQMNDYFGSMVQTTSAVVPPAS